MEMEKFILNYWKVLKIFISENKEKFINIIFYIFILLIFYIVISKILKKFIRFSVRLKGLKNKEEFQKERVITLHSAIDSILKVSAFVILLIITLKEFEINLVTFITGLGFLGVAIIAIFQSTIQDIIKGWIILFEDQVRKGEWISINNAFVGEVERLNLRYMILKDKEGNLIFFPNSQISSIINLSRAHKIFSIKIKIGKNLDLEDFLNKIREDLAKFKEENPKIVKISINENINIFQDHYELTINLVSSYIIGEKLLGELKKKIYSNYKENIIEIS